MNSFVNYMDNVSNLKLTENGAVARNTSNSALYDMFALGGAYRKRSDEDCISLFREAFYENPLYAVRCLFYLRDCRGGQGERRFFRTCFTWLAKNYEKMALDLIPLNAYYGRWDDVVYLLGENVSETIKSRVINVIASQLVEDMRADHPSLCAKWLPSENASSKETKRLARQLRESLELSSPVYRKMLSYLRKKINLVESQMSQNRWEEIEFDKVPSRAGLIYADAFAENEKTKERYWEFINSKETKVNAGVLYPSDIVGKALSGENDAAYNKYWENLPDYFDGESSSMICVCDTSGSMHGDPIKTSIALSMYAAQHNQGSFHNYFITFSRYPKFIKLDKRLSFAEQARKIYRNSINENTDLEAVFELLLNGVLNGRFDEEDLPKTVVVISDMEIDAATGYYWYGGDGWNKDNCASQMEDLRRHWKNYGLTLPKLVYWNVDARHDTILEIGNSVSLISGKSPVIFEQICAGKSGYDLMMDKLNSERYSIIE